MIPFASPLFAGLQSITIGDRARLQSSGSLLPLIVNWGSGTVEIGSDARTGSIQSVGPVLLKDRSLVDGSIETGATLTLQSQTFVAGTVSEHLSLSLPEQPAITSVWPASQQDAFTVDAGVQAVKAPGAYASATVHSNGSMILNAGTYFFNSLLLDADATVVINGAVTIEVRDDLTVRGLFKDSTGHIAQVAIRYRGTNTSVFEKEFHGSILAPSAQLILGASSGTEYRGQFVAQQLLVRPDIIATAEIPNDGGIFPATQEVTLPMLGAAHGIVIGTASRVQAPSNTLLQIIDWGVEPVTVGADAYTGPITSIGPIELGPRATVNGNIETASKVARGQGSVVTGTVTESVSPSLPFQPSPSESWPAVDQGLVVITSGNQKTLVPGAYGSLSLGSGAKAILTSGHYWFTSIDIPLDAEFEIHGTVIIESRDGLSALGKFVDASGSPASTQLLYWGTTPATIAGSFLGSAQAPHAQLTIGGTGVTIQGQVYAQQIIVEPNTILLPPTSAVPDIFTQSPPSPDPKVRTFTGKARVVVPRTSGTTPTRIVIQGAATADVIDAAVGGEIWVTPLGNNPWTVVVQTQNAQGEWRNSITSDGNPVNSNGIVISSIIVAAQGSNPSFVVQVQQQVSQTLPKNRTLTGTVTWLDGQPFSGIIRAYDQDLRKQQYLGIANTDSAGNYTIQFTNEQFQDLEFALPDIFIKAFDLGPNSNVEIWRGTSPVTFNAISPTTINLTLDGTFPSPMSEYERLDFRIYPLLGETLRENLNLESDANFLSNELSESLDKIKFYIQANQESKAISLWGGEPDPVPSMAFYGLYRKGFPIKTELLCRRTEADLKYGLDQALESKLINLSVLGTNSTDVAAAILRHQNKHLSTIITSSEIPKWVDPKKTSSFVELLKKNIGTPKIFWEQVKTSELLVPSDPKVPADPNAIIHMQTYYSLLQIVGGSIAMANLLMNELKDKADPSELVSLSFDKLRNLLRESKAVSTKISDADLASAATSLAQILERAFTKKALINDLNSIPTINLTRIQILLQHNPGIDPRLPLPATFDSTGLLDSELSLLKEEMEALRLQLTRYPVPLQGGSAEERRANLVAQLQSATYGFTSPLIKEVHDFLQAAPEFRFGRDRVSDLFAKHGSFFTGKSKELIAETQRWVRTIARLYAVYPSTAVANYLLSCGYKSAGQIARTSRDKFINGFDSTYGSDVASSIHRTARKIVQTSTQMHGLLQSSKNSLPVYALGTDQPSTETNTVSWSTLFERPVSERVPEWLSVLSPAAYFVELLRYLESLDAPSGKAFPYQALIQRRPDIVHIPLDKTSTFSEISHSQLVIEILQAFVAYSQNWTPTSWESISWPQIQDRADAALRNDQSYPFELPVDVEKHDQNLLLDCLGLSLSNLGTILSGSGTPDERDLLTCATLGLASRQLENLVSSNIRPDHLATLWGVDVNGLESLKTKISSFIDQAQITFVELKQYSVATFSQGAISVAVPDGADLATMTFGRFLENTDLHRANRFFRLLKQLRLIDPTRTVHDLDAALRAFGPDITRTSLQKLSAAVRIARRLGTGWYQALSLFANLDTKSELVDGDDGDLVTAISWYAQIYRVTERGTDTDFQINESTGDVLGSAKSLTAKAAAIRGALGLSIDAFDTIISLLNIVPDADNSFTLANLSSIYRTQLLSGLLATDPSNLILSADLLGYSNLTIPEYFESFLDDWDALCTFSISAGTLRYVYRNSVTGADSVTSISTQSDALMQSLIDGYATIDAGLAGLTGNAADIEKIQKSKKTELIGKIIGDAVGTDPTLILYLMQEQLIIPSTGAKGIDYLLNPDPIGDKKGWDLFAPLMSRLQKSVLFVSALSLTTNELKAITSDKTNWSNFNLNDFSETLDGKLNVSAISWFGIVFRYAYVRKLIPTTTATISPLLSLWTRTLDVHGLATITGWSADDIQTIASLRSSYGNQTNQIAYNLVGPINLVHKLGRPASVIVQWTRANNGDSVITAAIMDAVRQKFDTTNWGSAESKYLVNSRNFRRENLIKFVLQMPAIPTEVNTADRLYEYFLIDVSVDAAQMTSRIVQGLASIQQFVQRCILDLEKGIESSYVNFPAVSPTSFDPKRWSWMKNYRVWEANRQVFLFPENYIEPELRPDKSAFFTELETAISESEISTENVESAFQNYLQKLDTVARLKIVAQCTDPASGEFHIFGRTDGIPGDHYHRIRSKDGIWAGWNKLSVDIPSEHLLPIFNNRRLYLYWLEFSEKPNQPDSTDLYASGSTHSGTTAKKHWEISVAWIEYRFGKWSTKAITSPETGSLDQPIQGSTFRTENIDRDPSEYRFLADSASILNGIQQIPLRLLVASHRENIVARQRVITERIRNGFKIRNWQISPKYVTKTTIVTEMVNTGTFFTRLDQTGYWSVLRPGGRLIPIEVLREEYINEAWVSKYVAPLVKTDVDWINNSQSWKFEDKLTFMAPAAWHDDTSTDNTGIVGNRQLNVLLNASGELLLDPSDKDLLFQPPWKPFFFFDDHRSYLAEAVSKTYFRKLSRDISSQTASDLLVDPSNVDINYAGQFLVASSIPADKEEYFGEYFSSVNNGGSLQQLQIAQLHFSPHYHPYSAELLARLVSGGVENVITPDSQYLSESAQSFTSLFKPNDDIVSSDHPVENIDFSLTGAYSIYNWEIFFHIPLLIASRFVLEKKFEDARRWFHFIFDPTTDVKAGTNSSLRFWKFRPLQEKSDSDRVQSLLDLFDKSESDLSPAEVMEKRQVENQLSYSAEHPFEPHGIARLRLGAYQKAVFMKYLDNLTEWADQLFTTNTRESINEATQIYVLAKDLLGPAPDRVPLDMPEAPPDYASLRESIGQDGDALAAVEDWLANNRLEIADQDPTNNGDGDANSIAGPGSSDYFKLPENEKLANFWNVLDDRLYKIRNGLDINGNIQDLALFSPRLDPSALVGAASAGAGAGQNDGLTAQVPLYRFSVILPKALEFCNEVKSFGGALLSALEKNDAEGLGNLRARQEIALHKLTRNIREEQISEAEITLESLRKTREVTQQRHDYYAGLERNSQLETLQMSHMDSSGDYQLKAGEAHATSAILAAIPDLTAGASGFGGSPHVTLMAGGTFLSRAANAYASVQEVFAGLESHRSSKAGIQAGWERRNADWDFQVQIADKELAQIDSQLKGAEIRIRIAKAELASLELQLKSSQEIESFLSSKFTNQAMYGWMAAKLSSMYLKAYQMAYLLAKQVEACYTFERRSTPTVGISYDAWNSLRKGLLAGETLALDLRRLELEYMNKNTRDPEITKSVSLVSLDPSAVIALKTTGFCQFTLPEALFDLDHPGHFYRRIKSIAVTIPSVTGPYSGINGKLALNKSFIRMNDSDFASTTAVQDTRTSKPIFLSSGQGDTGMFETNLRDERFLPFEGCGIVNSQWELEVPLATNSFDLDTISDVVIRIQYTAAVSTSDPFKKAALNAASIAAIPFLPQYPSTTPLDPPKQTGIVKSFSLRHEFADAWYVWIQDTTKPLAITLTPERFPIAYRGKPIASSEIGLLVDATKNDAKNWSGASLSIGPKSTDAKTINLTKEFGGLPFASISIAPSSTIPAKLSFQITPTDPLNNPITVPNDLVLLVRYSVG